MSGRIAALDVTRGVAVMGILLLNIVGFALPSAAYSDPAAYGSGGGGDWWAWAITFVLFDGKMRGLFTLLFGASTMLVAQRALAAGRSPARVHYARMTALLAIGSIHAWLIWSGDILVLYSLCGAVLFVVWRWPPQRLAGAAVVLLALHLAGGIAGRIGVERFEAAATAPGATAQVKADWRAWRTSLAPSAQAIAREVTAYRGGWADVSRARVAETARLLPVSLTLFAPATIALMLLGMALYRSGFFEEWPESRHRRVAAIGCGVALPLEAWVACGIDAGGFDPVQRLALDAVHLSLLCPVLTIAYASALVLGARIREGWALDRIAAVGRTALSNYLGTSLICTLLFYGYGLGLFGRLDRWALYPVVALVWLLMLAWSAPWLRRFGQGPAERLWRGLARSGLGSARA